MIPPRVYTRLFIYRSSAVLACFYGWPKVNRDFDVELEMLYMALSHVGLSTVVT